MRPDGAPGNHLSDDMAAIVRLRSILVALVSAMLNCAGCPSRRGDVHAGHRQRSDAAALVAFQHDRRQADRLAGARQGDAGVALLEAAHGERAHGARGEHGEAEHPVVGRVVAREVEALDQQRVHAPSAAGRLVGHRARSRARRGRPAADRPSGSPPAACGRPAARSIGQASPDASQRPTFSSSAARLGFQVQQRDAPGEQAHAHLVDLGRAVALDLALDAGRGVPLDHRHGGDRRAGENDNGDQRNDAFSHGSASGCLDGWAASKAGCCMQAAWMRWMVG